MCTLIRTKKKQLTQKAAFSSLVCSGHGCWLDDPKCDLKYVNFTIHKLSTKIYAQRQKTTLADWSAGIWGDPRALEEVGGKPDMHCTAWH
jgi:hypothetical protein